MPMLMVAQRPSNMFRLFQGRISAEVKITDSTFCFTQSQHTDSEPCGPNTDPANSLKCRMRVYVTFSGEWAFEVKSRAGIAQSVVCWTRCPA